MKQIYIAGPMRGFAEYNFPAFDAAAKRLRKLGWRVWNPAEMDRMVGVTEFTSPLPEGFLRGAMERDCAAICKCDAIYLLKGWQDSAGVNVELTLARFLKLELHFEDEQDAEAEETSRLDGG